MKNPDGNAELTSALEAHGSACLVRCTSAYNGRTSEECCPEGVLDGLARFRY